MRLIGFSFKGVPSVQERNSTKSSNFKKTFSLPLVVGAKIDNELFHAPIPGPTRLADPNRFRGVKPYTGTLYLFFFSELNLYMWVYKQFFCNNQKSFTYTKELPPEWYPLKSIHIC